MIDATTGRRATPAPAYPVPRTIEAVTRQLMYSADRTYDAIVDSEDVRRNGKLAKALLTISGRTSMGSDAVRAVVAGFAGTDRKISDAEFGALATAVRRITQPLKQPDMDHWPPVPQLDAAGAARATLSMTDHDFDGDVDRADAALGSDPAAIVLDALNSDRLNEAQLERAVASFIPELDKAQNIRAFFDHYYNDLQRRATQTMGVGDLARAAIWAHDINQDLLLTRHDGAVAKATLIQARRTSMRDADVAKLYARYDTEIGPMHDVSEGADGRLNGREIAAAFNGR